MNALGDFRCAILDDTYLTDEIREAVLERLDAAFSPVQEEIPGHDHYALPNKLIHLEAPTADTNHDWLCGCGHWNGPGLSVCATCGRTPLGNDPT
jgi:hypothetical protein